jgi:hypothetical protein
VSIERGPTHIGPVQDVLDGQLGVTLLHDEREQRFDQEPARAADPPIVLCHARLAFPNKRWRLPGIGRPPRFGC